MSKQQTMRLGEIEPNNFNPNEMSKEKYAALKESIKKDGIMQPLIVRPIMEMGDPAGFEIIDGEHRFKVANELKMKSVPVIIEKVKTDADAMRLCYKINTGRGTMDCFKEAVFFDLLNQRGLKDNSLAKEYGLSEQFIKDRKKLISINQEERELLLKKVSKDAELTGAHWLVYAKATPEVRIELCRHVGNDRKLSVRDLIYRAKNAVERIKEIKQFEAVLKKTKFPKCPICKGKATALNYQKHLRCEKYHDWNPKTGKSSQEIIGGTYNKKEKKKVKTLARNVHIEIDWKKALEIAQRMALGNLVKIQEITFLDKKGKQWIMKIERDSDYEGITLQYDGRDEYNLSMRDPTGKGKRTAYVRGPQFSEITPKHHKEMIALVKQFKGKITDKRLLKKEGKK